MRHLFTLLLASCSTTAIAQPSTYYDRQAQNREYDRLHEATTRAYSVPSSSSSGYKSPSSSYSSGSSSSSSSSSYRSNAGGTIAPASRNTWANTDHYDWQVRQGEKIAAANASRAAAYEASVSRYRALIADRGVARTEADHFDLLLTGMRENIDYRAMKTVIGDDIEEYRKLYGTSGAPFKPGDPAALRANAFISAALTEKNPLVRAAFYKEAIARFPTAELTQKMADASREAHAYGDAIEGYKKSDAIEGGRFAVLFGWATACAMRGDAAEAEAQYGRALAVSPGAPAQMNVAWVRLQQGNTAGAIESLKKEAAQQPGNLGPLLAEAALTTDAAAKEALVTKAIALRPTLAAGTLGQKLYDHAKYLQGDGAYELSVFFLDFAVAAEPKNIDFLELRYGTNKKLGRSKQADEDELTMSEL